MARPNIPQRTQATPQPPQEARQAPPEPAPAQPPPAAPEASTGPQEARWRVAGTTGRVDLRGTPMVVYEGGGPMPLRVGAILSDRVTDVERLRSQGVLLEPA